MSRCSINVWVGNYDTYEIPDYILADVRMTARGRPDKRSPSRYRKFMDWVSEKEEKAQKENACV